MQQFGADPSQARSVDTGENGPEVIAYPGVTGACLVVLFDNGEGGMGGSYSCKPYGEIAKGTWLVTFESPTGKPTQYVGLLPDGYRSVRVNAGGREVGHRVVDNVYSFAHAGPRSDAHSVAPDGSRRELGTP